MEILQIVLTAADANGFGLLDTGTGIAVYNALSEEIV